MILPSLELSQTESDQPGPPLSIPPWHELLPWLLLTRLSKEGARLGGKTRGKRTTLGCWERKLPYKIRQENPRTTTAILSHTPGSPRQKNMTSISLLMTQYSFTSHNFLPHPFIPVQEIPTSQDNFYSTNIQGQQQNAQCSFKMGRSRIISKSCGPAGKQG